jgi:hypothetical protein
VPIEFVGLARLFRGQCKVEDSAYDGAVLAIAKPLKARLTRHPKLRHEQIAQAERLYRSTVPAKFRVGELAIERDRAKFGIAEVRICPAWFNSSLWQDENYREPGCALCEFAMFVEAGKLRHTIKPIAVVSLHALGRRLERGRGREQAALIRDIALLAGATGDGDVATPEADGLWVGHMVKMQGQNLASTDPQGWALARAVRTWRP